jgi:hypothetical protein
MNSFKELQKQQEEMYKDNLDGIKNSLQSNLGVIGAFTDLFDTFINKFIKCLLNSITGEQNTNNEKD